MRVVPTDPAGDSRVIATADNLSSILPGLLERVRAEIRRRHYSRRTEDAYLAWIARYMRFHGLIDPLEAGGSEVEKFLSHLATRNDVAAAMLIYGAGLRLLECLQLRVKDIDFGYHQITVRAGKGNRDRVTVLPPAVETRLQHHLEEVKRKHERDLINGGGYVKLPRALSRKYPDANRQWGWQWVFPAHRQFTNPETGHLYRHHLD